MIVIPDKPLCGAGPESIGPLLKFYDGSRAFARDDGYNANHPNVKVKAFRPGWAALMVTRCVPASPL